MLGDKAEIDSLISFWKSRNPSFLWAPTSRDTWLLDQARGAKGTAIGKGAQVGPGGLPITVGNSSDSWLAFPSRNAMTTQFISILLVSVRDASSITGAFLKIGEASGIAVGAGNTTFENSGTKPIMLQEGVAWRVGATGNFLVNGLNVISFGYTNQNVLTVFNLTSQIGHDYNGAIAAQSANSTFYINGYSALRGSNCRVSAMALYAKSLSNAEFAAEREILAGPALKYSRASTTRATRLFTPKAAQIYATAAAPTGNIYTITPSGGVALSGSESLRRSRIFLPSGSVSFSGTVPLLRTRVQFPSGGVVFGGNASITFIPATGGTIYTITPSGGFTLSGAQALKRSRVQVPSGGLALTGTASFRRERVLSPTGGVSFAGNAYQVRTRIIAPTGGVILSGSAPIIFIPDGFIATGESRLTVGSNRRIRIS